MRTYNLTTPKGSFVQSVIADETLLDIAELQRIQSEVYKFQKRVDTWIEYLRTKEVSVEGQIAFMPFKKT